MNNTIRRCLIIFLTITGIILLLARSPTNCVQNHLEKSMKKHVSIHYSGLKNINIYCDGGFLEAKCTASGINPGGEYIIIETMCKTFSSDYCSPLSTQITLKYLI